MTGFNHTPVLLKECIDGLKIKDGGFYFDGTLGGGGHSENILKKSAPNGKLIATDLDDKAIAWAKERLKEYSGRFTLINDNFKNFENLTKNLPKFDGILLDLGVSSYQIDSRERGFSYMSTDSQLDMRMDAKQSLTAFDIVNCYSEDELSTILKKYGEETFANTISKNIVKARMEAKITTTGELNEIIEKSIPFKFKKKGHPSKKTYQALRIEVNDELTGLYQTIIDMVERLNDGGRIAIISFHSLEDRIVKQAFNYLYTECTCPKELPICVCDKVRKVKLINKKPIQADENEIKDNPRSKSAKLRIAEKI